MDAETVLFILSEIDFEIPGSTQQEVIEFVKQQEKQAELGRLALKTRAMVCSNNDFIKRGAKQCEKHCTNYKYCKLRFELLVEVPNES